MLKKSKKEINKKRLLNPNVVLPKKGESIFLLEDNGISIFDYLLKIANEEKIYELYITSFRISKRDLMFLEELIKEKKIPIPKLTLSDSIPTMVVGTFNYLKENPNFETNYINTHGKTCEVITEENNYFIISSGNFNPDGKVEQINIINYARRMG